MFSQNFTTLLYLVSAVFFILALRGLSSPKTAVKGNIFGMTGMTIAVAATIINYPPTSIISIIATIITIALGAYIGSILAKKVEFTEMPQLVAAFHSLVGLAAVLVALSAFIAPEQFGIGNKSDYNPSSLIETSLGLAIGAITFTGSIIAFLKLQGLMKGTPITFKYQHHLNLTLIIMVILLTAIFAFSAQTWQITAILLIALTLGVLIVIPIGGADMPVVVSMLNSYSGWAAAGIGFTLSNVALIVTGALVGSSGAILSYIMCKGMNRSFLNVILGGFGNEVSASKSNEPEKPIKQGSAEDAAYIMQNVDSVIIVPGYGLAVAQAQHLVSEMAQKLKKSGVKVRYAIHPVAGRMPGHMNVLLAEANIEYEDVLELEEINNDFSTTGVAFVIGANDVTNPAAKNDPTSPIYGMPILNVEDAQTVIFIKRSMAAGYAGIENQLFYKDNTMMLFGDAKKVVSDIIKAMEH